MSYLQAPVETLLTAELPETGVPGAGPLLARLQYAALTAGSTKATVS